jgi:hypothetical protein
MPTTTKQSRATLLEWRELRKGTLIGFAKIRFSSGLIMADIAIHVAGSRAWASPPARPWIKDGATVIDDDTGKTKYQQLIEFVNHGTRASWSRQVIDAVRAAQPELFAAEVTP